MGLCNNCRWRGERLETGFACGWNEAHRGMRRPRDNSFGCRVYRSITNEFERSKVAMANKSLFTEEEQELIVQMVHAGRSAADIAGVVHKAPKQVNGWLKNHKELWKDDAEDDEEPEPVPELGAVVVPAADAAPVNGIRAMTPIRPVERLEEAAEEDEQDEEEESRVDAGGVIASLRAENERLNEQLKVLTTERDETICGLKSDIASLQDTIAGYRKERSELRESNESLEAENRRLEGVVELKENALINLREENHRRLDRNLELEDGIRYLRQQVVQLTPPTQESDSHAEAVQKEATELKKAYDQLMCSHAAVNEALSRSLRETAELKDIIVEMVRSQFRAIKEDNND